MAFDADFLNLTFAPDATGFPIWAGVDLTAAEVLGTGIVVTATWTYGIPGATGGMEIINFLRTGGYEFWSGDWGFALVPFRIPRLDRYCFGPENIGSAMANLTLSHFHGGIQRLTAASTVGDTPPDIPPGATGSFISSYDSDDGNTYQYSWFSYETEPSSMGLTLGLFGCRVAGDAWEIIPLGGGSDFSFTALNDGALDQNLILDVTAFCKSYLANKNNFDFFAWAVTPATAQNLVTEIDPDDAQQIGEALWAMLAKGSMHFENKGYIVGHTGDPAYALNFLNGEITTSTFIYDNTTIGPINIQLTGDMALPGGARVGPYGVPMTPL